MRELNVRKNPQHSISQWVKNNCSAYRKHTVFLHVAETCDIGGQHWDGGSRDTYSTVDKTGKHGSVPCYKWAESASEFDLDDAMVVVNGGTFCGKPSTLSLTFHPNHPLASDILAIEDKRGW